MFSLAGSGECFRKKSQIPKNKSQINSNWQKPKSKQKSVVDMFGSLKNQILNFQVFCFI